MAYELKPKKEEEDAFPATSDVVNAAPGAMSHRDIVAKSREFWGPEIAGHPGTEGAAVVTAARPSAVYQAPASNLPAGPISVTELKSRSAEWAGGNSKLRPNTLPSPGV